ncbi:hypothetical protein ACYOEI_31770 [Singulisphaera rosea]
MQYNIWLGNPAGMNYNWQLLCDEVFALFKPVIAKTHFTGPYVRSTMAKPAMQVHDLLIYVVASQERGVLAARFGYSQMPDDQYGQTSWEGMLTGSEVYTRGMSPKFIANLVFHEALHNKTHQGNSLHSHDGLAGSPIGEYTELSSGNISLMAKSLKKHHPQWVDGFDAVTQGSSTGSNSSDPLDGL